MSAVVISKVDCVADVDNGLAATCDCVMAGSPRVIRSLDMVGWSIEWRHNG